MIYHSKFALLTNKTKHHERIFQNNNSGIYRKKIRRRLFNNNFNLCFDLLAFRKNVNFNQFMFIF